MKSAAYKIICILITSHLMLSCQRHDNIDEKNTKKTENDTVKKKFSGIKKTRWGNGKLKQSITYVDGMREGVTKNFNPLGKLVSEIPYSQNMINGTSKNYYEDGNLQSSIDYVNNAKHGKEFWYYESGKLYRESDFKHGKLDGKRTAWYENGNLMYESFFKGGEPGLGLKEYEQNGELSKQPYIITEEIDNIKFTGEYIVLFKLSDNSTNVVFFAGDLTDGKYLNNYLSPIKTHNGKGKTVFNVKPGTILMHTINVVAKKKTSMRNMLVAQKKVNIAVENR